MFICACKICHKINIYTIYLAVKTSKNNRLNTIYISIFIKNVKNPLIIVAGVALNDRVDFVSVMVPLGVISDKMLTININIYCFSKGLPIIKNSHI